jgi:hypothetical protein
MANELPPSGRWSGYYLYGHGGSRHCMKLTLAFSANRAIDGDGVDDIATFVITGRFDVVTTAACWTKAYVGMHTVEYSGLYCRRAICGDWTLPESATAEQQEGVMAAMRQLENEVTLIGASAHIMGIATKRND